MIKYIGSIDNNIAKFLMDSIKRGESVIIEIIPHFYATWDHGKGTIQQNSFLLNFVYRNRILNFSKIETDLIIKVNNKKNCYSKMHSVAGINQS